MSREWYLRALFEGIAQRKQECEGEDESGLSGRFVQCLCIYVRKCGGAGKHVDVRARQPRAAGRCSFCGSYRL